MKLINNSTRNYIAFDTILEAGKVLDIKDSKTVNILKTQPGVEEYIDKEEVERLKKEAAKAKEEAKKAKEEAKKAEEKAKKEDKKIEE
jgi:coenzyme F420-reducing hydrogenase alpha subunit